MASALEVIPAIVTASAAVVGVVIAYAGLQTWKAQLKGRAAYDVARATLRGALRVRNAIESVRAPFISVGEMHHAFKETGIDPVSA
jgi:hypothetical protein